MKLLVAGADPELFLKHPETHELISAIGIVPGNKDNPYDISDVLQSTKDGFAIQVDNVAAEFCIPPSASKEELTENILLVLNNFNKIVETDVCISTEASAIFPPELLNNPIAQTFGCDPDFNAWTERENRKPQSVNKNLRSVGGHIHVGYDDISTQASLNIIKAMDLFLGVPSILLDSDTQRRELYGKAGAFRFKPYGVEYRTLSNFWIFSKDTIEWVFENTSKAVEFVNNEDNISILNSLSNEIQTTINTNNLESAKALLEKFNIKLPEFTKINN